MLLILLLLFLVTIFIKYDDILFKIAEYTLLEPNSIVYSNDHYIRLKMAIEGKNYDLLIPFDVSRKSMMRKAIIKADGERIYIFPGCWPEGTVSQLGFKEITIKYKHEKKVFSGDNKLEL